MTTDFERYLFACVTKKDFVISKETTRAEMRLTRSKDRYIYLRNVFVKLCYKENFWEKVIKHYADKLDGKLSYTFDIVRYEL